LDVAVIAPDPDLQLLDKIARGDREALRVLYRRHGRQVYGLALRIVRDGSTAEEVTQDVFVRVWDRAGTYRQEKARVTTWILRIARNRAIDILRSRAPARELRPWDWETDEPDPADQFDLSEQQDEVRRAMDCLPPAQKAALRLAFYQGHTHREISAELGVPLGTVKTRIRDALLKLREQLSQKRGP